jgi:hypothetical protein
VATTDVPTGGGEHRGPDPGRWRALLERSGLRDAAPILELLALSSFVFARPAFASFGDSPESLIARGSDWNDVVLFGLAIALGPLVALVGVEAVVGLVAGARTRRIAHLVLVGGLLTLVVWELANPAVDLTPRRMSAMSAAGGLVLLAARLRFAPVATFLRYASVGAVVFLVQFLLLSPTASIVRGGRHAPLASVDVPADAAPVVMVVLDGLPTEMLLDGEGGIDAELYPNLAALAGDATWYRNHTTVAQITLEAVPAILSGSLPSPAEPPAVASKYPHNLFTLLGRSHDVHGGETITGLCPVELCPEPAGSPVAGLLGDVAHIWELQMTGATIDPELVPHAFDRRLPRATHWIEAQDFRQDGRPNLHVFHLLLPHPGWEYLPDGSRYGAAPGVTPTGLFIDAWSGWGQDVAMQRHVLQTQAADRALGDLLDRLRDDGAYDDSLVVVTADHGYAFTDEAPLRGVDEANADQILWTPLLVKEPGQRTGVVDDSNVNSTDILPTIAAELGIDLPWEVDGVPLGTAGRDPGDKWVVDWEVGRLHPDGDDQVVHVDGEDGFAEVLATDPVEGTGPLAVWQRTEYGHLVGRSLDDGAATVGAPLGVTAASVDRLGSWDDVDPAAPPLELTAQAPIPEGTRVAVTVDGVVAAVVPTVPTPYGTSIVHALLWPGAVHAGANTMGMYAVDGPAAAPVLHAIGVRPR